MSDITAFLRRRRLQIAATFLVVFAAVVVVTLLMPKIYESHMKVLVKNERADMIVSPDHSDNAEYRGQVSENEINSEIEILTSNDLLRDVVVKNGLDRRQHFSDPAVNIERAVNALHKNLVVSPVRKSNVILVEYSDIDPHKAASVLTSLADLYLEEHLKVHGTPGSYEFFKAQTEKYEGDLRTAEAQVADLRQRDNIIAPAEQRELALQKAADAQSALNQTETQISEYSQKIADLRAQLRSIQPRVVTQTRTSSNEYSVERLHTMLAELQNHRTQLLAKFQPGDRMVQEADQEIADTQAALAGAKKLTGQDQATDVNPLYQSLQIEVAKQEAELAGAQSGREALSHQLWDYRKQSMKLADDSTAFDDLLRTQKAAEDNYALYVKKTEEARIAESLDKEKIANVAIAESPLEPHLPSKPNKAMNFLLGGMFAAFFSVALAFVSEYFRDTVSEPRELEELTRLSVLARSYGD
ncbi:MAG TPA: Wzz/FepE/Etk N-terminal domain-containing protein [Bryobacteraceae bacterium]|nr:Wzz/FepE/Etk N-terminal domain-containing protein [Bryobacteraceae bacterium]